MFLVSDVLEVLSCGSFGPSEKDAFGALMDLGVFVVIYEKMLMVISTDPRRNWVCLIDNGNCVAFP